MTIREATPADDPYVLALARDFIHSTQIGAVTGCTDAALAQLLEVVRVAGVIFVAAEGHQVVGFIAVVAIPHPFSGAVFAEEVAWFVQPDRRAGTAGPRLLQAAEEWTRQRNCWCLKMGAPVDQPGVGRFYERRGYRAVETAYIKRCDG